MSGTYKKELRECEWCHVSFLTRVEKKPARFCSLLCGGRARRKPSIALTRGYRGVRVDGYSRSRLEHVVVAERALGHPLPPMAVVHHVNENPADNRNGNLCICEDCARICLL